MNDPKIGRHTVTVNVSVVKSPTPPNEAIIGSPSPEIAVNGHRFLSIPQLCGGQSDA